MSDAASLVKMASGSDEAGLPLVVDRTARRTRTRFIPKLLRLVGRIPFADDLAAAWYCAYDRRTPLRVKGVLFAALAYFVLPADFLPDFIAGLGFTDDATVLATALSVVGAYIKPRHRSKARRLLGLPPEPASDDET